MKTIIAFLCALALTSAAAATYQLCTESSITVSLTLTPNTANSSNVDVAWVLDYPDTLPSETEDTVNAVICLNAANSTYAIANSTTGLTAAAVKWSCASGTGNCNSAGEYNTNFEQRYSVLGASSSTGTFNTGAMTDNTATFTSDVNDTSQTVTRTVSAVTPAAMTTAGLPNTSSTYYWRCWGKLGAATATNLATGITNIAATYTVATNVTVKGASYGVAAVLAVAGSLVASFAF